MGSRKNVLMICTDHWSGSLLGCEGRTDIMTPTLDYLAKQGCVSRTFTANARCASLPGEP